MQRNRTHRIEYRLAPRSRREGGAPPSPAPYDNLARHRPAPAGGSDGRSAMGSERPRGAAAHPWRPRWNGTPESELAGWRHGIGAARELVKRAGAVAPPPARSGTDRGGGDRVM